MGTLTDAQVATLRTNMLADPALATHIANQDVSSITEYYNTDDPGPYIVWRSDFTPERMRAAIVWTEVDALTVGKARIWEWLTNRMTTTINMNDGSVRQALGDAFTGTSTLSPLRNAAKRNGTRIEKMFATGTGAQGVPSVLGFEGPLALNDVIRASTPV